MKKPFGLYLVITDPVTSYETCAEAAVRAGLRVIQLRMKHVSRERIVATAKNLRAITTGTRTLFIVNDDPAIAAEVGADGVHLGQTDLSVPIARERFPSLKIFGLST
ncbi:MAG: thiamine phosphate synthase, partial [Opitutales bacterium]|nr:thiamine phosphate synthase [Opitutales bacterium]